MSPSAIEQQRERIIYVDLPLAVYREIAAHLQQVTGIKTTLLPQTAQHFTYQQSQVGGLKIEYTAFDPREQDIVEAILNYYARRYGIYQRL